MAADTRAFASDLTIFDAENNWRTVALPPNATVRLGTWELFIPAGERKIVGPHVGGYELLSWAPVRLSRRDRVRAWLHTLVDRMVPRG